MIYRIAFCYIPVFVFCTVQGKMEYISKMKERSKMDKSKKIMKIEKPPVGVPQTLQYDLFTDFYHTASSKDISNSIEIWDSIPKYFMPQKEQSKIRSVDGALKPLERSFQVNSDSDCSVMIEPAYVRVDGELIAFYPSEREELIEKVLRKFFEDSSYGVFEKDKQNSWVFFSKNMIRKELKKMGHTASDAEIEHSITVLSKASITIYVNGKEVYINTIIDNLIKVDRDTYEKDGLARWACKLPSLISSAMENGEYRQFTYSIGMSLKKPLSRWLHQLLSHKYIHASSSNHYDIWFNTVIQNSGHLDVGDTQAQMRKMKASLDELAKFDVIIKGERENFKENPEKRSSKIKNARFRVYASESFINQMRASNKKIKDVKDKLSNQSPKLLK